MSGSSWSGSVRCILIVLVVLTLALAGLVYAQGIQTSQYSAPSVLRGLTGPGSTPSPPSPFAPPGSALGAGSDTASISSGMFQGILPPIPNLQVGYLYNFGKHVRSGRFTADYLLPVKLGAESRLFGEAHTEWQSFWKMPGFNNRVDVSLGGGYRTILLNKAMVGVNGFYDTSRLGEQWYSSGSFGFETAALLSGSDALDLRANWYGKLFNSSVIMNAFRYGPSNYDFQAGFSHELWNGGPDFRVSATGYQFDVGNRVYGWNTGAELKSRDGVFVVKYAVGRDPINRTYQTVGAFVNVGFRMENVLKGESPFITPQPIFKSPRNILTWLDSTLSYLRNFSQPASVLIAQQIAAQQPTGPTPPGPTPSCLLSGSQLVLTHMAQNVKYPATPPIPDLSSHPLTVTIYWCGLQSTRTVQFIFNDGLNDSQTPQTLGNVTLIAPSDHMTFPMDYAPLAETGTQGVTAGNNELFFDPGGGISFTFP